MSQRLAGVDKPFLIITIILIVAGFSIFSSAALGLLARESANYSSVAFSQTVLGLFLGGVFLFVNSRVSYKFWRKTAFWFLLLGLVATALVFVPQLGMRHGGAVRWLDLGPVSFQPVELLKLGFVIYLSAWYASIKERVKTTKYGLLPLLVILALAGIILYNQPDTGNIVILAAAGFAIFLSAGARLRDLAAVGLIGLVFLASLAVFKPYVRDRLVTFFDPGRDVRGSGWQIDQSLIAIGKGGLLGTGLGQSVQKFTHLPEPMGDSVFAVAGEEFGFVGSTFLVLLFASFAIRGLKIASNLKDNFGRLLVVGIVIMITSQAFVNIGAMLGLIPLSGITLPFVSHGGTSLFFTLFAVGIVLSASRSKES